MSHINPYLTFNGECEEAFNLYQSIFGGEFTRVSRFKDLPPDELAKVEESYHEKILHISLPINDECILMGSDTNPAMADEVVFGKNITLSASADSKEQADAFFEGLSKGGTVFMPISDMFWGDYFGMCEDKFGMNWMVNFTPGNKK